ncbi:MAG: superoxide dismutase [Lachnospiraceae bacterium]|nr:superoxide dismutase [Lachnospiraceae bacterium]
MKKQHYPFELQKLPYSYDALIPFLNEETLYIHHEKHQKNYVDQLNKALKDYPEYHQLSLEEILINPAAIQEPIRETVVVNAGGVYNHQLYFKSMQPHGFCLPTGALFDAINQAFGDYYKFQKAVVDTSMSLIGSGYLNLVKNEKREVELILSKNQDTPLPEHLLPLITLDLWEHAYYLQYQNRKIDYVQNWIRYINWKEAELRFGK